VKMPPRALERSGGRSTFVGCDMASFARIKTKDEQPADDELKPVPSSRRTLARVRTMAALAAARFELDHDAIALVDVVDLIVQACNEELAP
jgi:hypothetical protein